MPERNEQRPGVRVNPPPTLKLPFLDEMMAAGRGRHDNKMIICVSAKTAKKIRLVAKEAGLDISHIEITEI